MALLVCISAAFFELKVHTPTHNPPMAWLAKRGPKPNQVNAHSWLGIGIILTSTHLYMNIAIRR